MSKAPLYTVTIEAYGSNDFDVRHNGRVYKRLCWEEMLGTIAEITHAKIGACRFSSRAEDEPSRYPREDEIAAAEGRRGEAA